MDQIWIRRFIGGGRKQRDGYPWPAGFTSLNIRKNSFMRLDARNDGEGHRPPAVPPLCLIREAELFLAPAELSRALDVFCFFHSNENTSARFFAMRPRSSRSHDPSIPFGSIQSAVLRIRFATENEEPSELPGCSFLELSAGNNLRNSHPYRGSEIEESSPMGRLPAFAAPSTPRWDER